MVLFHWSVPVRVLTGLSLKTEKRRGTTNFNSALCNSSKVTCRRSGNWAAGKEKWRDTVSCYQMMAFSRKGASLGTTKALHKQYQDNLVLFDKNELKNQCEFTALTGK